MGDFSLSTCYLDSKTSLPKIFLDAFDCLANRKMWRGNLPFDNALALALRASGGHARFLGVGLAACGTAGLTAILY